MSWAACGRKKGRTPIWSAAFCFFAATRRSLVFAWALPHHCPKRLVISRKLLIYFRFLVGAIGLEPN